MKNGVRTVVKPVRIRPDIVAEAITKPIRTLRNIVCGGVALTYRTRDCKAMEEGCIVEEMLLHLGRNKEI